jgi:hypothetical protein
MDASWTAPGGQPNQAALNDYAWRAVHTMTERGKQIVNVYYGRPEQKAYFEGCSSGGRMALMEAQRFPADYDGIVSGAPVYSLKVQLAEIYRDWIFAQPGAAITPSQINLIHQAVLAACDQQDGLKDGILTDPRMCRFDPAVLKCGAGMAGDQCLTEAQITAVRREYSAVIGPDGQTYIYPFSRGSEPGWIQAVNISADPAKAASARPEGGHVRRSQFRLRHLRSRSRYAASARRGLRQVVRGRERRSAPVPRQGGQADPVAWAGRSAPQPVGHLGLLPGCREDDRRS